MGAALVAPGRPASDAGNGPPLEGLWISETEFGSPARGELTVRLQGARGRAEIGGRVASFTVEGDSIRFALGGAAGTFRGRIEHGAREIRGFWIQPPSTGVEGPFGQAYATPLRLAAAGRDRYRGTVVPVPTRFTLYLSMWSDSTGWRGAFRNPQFNLTGGASRFRVRSAADSLYFTAQFADANEPAIQLVAQWDQARSIIRMPWQGLESPVVFAPCDARQAAGFWPRRRGESTRYREPVHAADGWTTARASQAGMDEEALACFTRALADTSPIAPRAPLVHSCLIERHGRLVFEEYFFGFDRDTPHDLRSAAKTFASVLVGTAMRHGAVIGPDSPVYASMAARGPFANPDPRKSQITLAHLLTHTSGLACDDNSDDSPGAEWHMQASQDWWKHTLDLPVEAEPGTRYAYCSGGTNLVGGVVAGATGRWIPEFFDATVASPLDFGRYHYNLMPDGEGYLGGGVHMRPRDLLKLGRVYLDGGRRREQRIVDSTWVQVSTADQVPDSTRAEGYAWHLVTLKHGGREYRAYEASGNGGQFLIVIPELDLSVVFTAGNYMMYGIWRHFRDDLVPNRIIAGVRDR